MFIKIGSFAGAIAIASSVLSSSRYSEFFADVTGSVRGQLVSGHLALAFNYVDNVHSFLL